MIAQDLQKTEFADYFVLTQPGEEGYLAVKTPDLVSPLIVVVQKLTKEVESLKAER